ncbi:hypothetical protein BDV59DRAFT_203888 [Aspergillus ambiguus]|uniref:3-oxo-5-alpha-steroid 4-dehydrogenase family protein n=1 Tax=Aspergillus ambiguus TaxID=176160 RepID=UPI003CCE0E57
MDVVLSSLPPWREFMPPTPETYIIALFIFQYFPMFSIIQWLTSFHPAGKTSLNRSFLNFPGKPAWFIMEIVGPANLLFALGSQSQSQLSALPGPNKLVAALYLTHYANRAIITPFFVAPSMSPIHLLVILMAVAFNWLNSTCIAAWVLGAPVPVHGHPSAPMPPASPLTTLLPYVGIVVFALGMLGNIRAERTLFRLRREAADQRAAKKDSGSGSSSSTKDADAGNASKYAKVYVIPPATGLFRFILYPHYACEWLEWLGFALVGTAVHPSAALAAAGPSAAVFGSAAELLPLRLVPWLEPAAGLAERLGMPLPLPAVVFVVNAVTNMLPHARWGRKWYVQKFGEEAVAGRGAVVPYCSWM